MSLQTCPPCLRIVNFLIILLSLFTITSVHAENLEEIYRKALVNDPLFVGSLHARRAAEESLNQAQAGYLPNVSLDIERTETTQDVISSDNAVFAVGQTRFPTNSYTLKLTQPLFQWASIVRIRQAEVESKKAEIEFFKARQDLILRTSERYMKVLAAQDLLEFSETEKVAVKRQLDLAKGRYKMGLARLTDKLDAEARYAWVESVSVENRFAVEDTQQELRESTGELPQNLNRLKNDIVLERPEPEDLQAWVDIAMESNPDILIARYAVEIARHEQERQKAGHLPTLDVVARQNYRDTGGTLFGGGSEVKNRDILLRFSLPIYEGGMVSSRSRETAELYAKAKQDLEQQIRLVVRKTTAAYHGVISAISKVEALSHAVKSQQRTLKAKREGFKSGLNTNIHVLDAERDLYQAKKDYAQARYEYLLNSLRLKKVTGNLTEQDLLAINNWLE